MVESIAAYVKEWMYAWNDVRHIAHIGRSSCWHVGLL